MMISIRKMEQSDVEILADLWLRTSLVAHDFIPQEYWIKNKSLMVETYLPNAEVYVADNDTSTLGFIALINNHIASIFVDVAYQGKGIGSTLLNHAKSIRTALTLNVYQKNLQSVQFYLSKGFIQLSETIDQATKEKELMMRWQRTD